MAAETIKPGDLKTVEREIRHVWLGLEQLADFLEPSAAKVDGPALACLIRSLAGNLDDLGNNIDLKLNRMKEGGEA